MKKLFATLSLLFLLPVIVCAAGCNSGWTEVQSITYTTEEGTTTLTSECVWDIDTSVVEQSDYDNATSEQKNENYFILELLYDAKYETIDIDRNQFIAKADSNIEKSYYHFDHDYYKFTLKRYTLKYVKVKVISDIVIEIDYDNEIKQISTLSYEITYFKN